MIYIYIAIHKPSIRNLCFIVVYELDGEGIDGKIKNFEKPWAMTTGKFETLIRFR
jgi:hypothetical protein